MAFDARSKVTSIKGKDYLEVKWRIAWMRDENPNWGVDTFPMQVGDHTIVKACVYNDDGRVIASGIATVRDAGKGETSWSGREFEKAETAAIGRALAVAGYGTQFTGDEFDEGEYLSDAPVARQSVPAPAEPTHDTPAEGTRKSVTITKRETKTTKTGKPMIVFSTTDGDQIFLFSRKIFKDAGYIDENDWATIGEIEAFRLTCEVEADENGYWQIDPDSVPPFDPQFEAIPFPGMPKPKWDGDVPM